MTRVQKLEKALEWVLNGNRIVDWGSGITGMTIGCGCCSYDTEIPENLRSELVAAYHRMRPDSTAQRDSNG